jgi:phage terminase small subunit
MPTPAKTNAEKKLTGSYRPSNSKSADPPQGVYGRPDVPPNLTPLQVEIFEHICDMMEDAEWLRVSDGETVESYAILKSRLRTNQEEFTAAEFTQLRMLANELGLSPAARAKMPIKAAEEKKSDFDDI